MLKKAARYLFIGILFTWLPAAICTPAILCALNVVHYVVFSCICYAFGFCMFLLLWKHLGRKGAYDLFKPVSVGIFAILIVMFMAACPLELAALMLNRYAGQQAVYYEDARILKKDFQLHGRASHSSTFVVRLQLADEPPGKTVIYPVDIDDSQLYRTARVGDRIRIGLRRGGLGFTYVASVEALS